MGRSRGQGQVCTRARMLAGGRVPWPRRVTWPRQPRSQPWPRRCLGRGKNAATGGRRQVARSSACRAAATQAPPNAAPTPRAVLHSPACCAAGTCPAPSDALACVLYCWYMPGPICCTRLRVVLLVHARPHLLRDDLVAALALALAGRGAQHRLVAQHAQRGARVQVTEGDLQLRAYVVALGGLWLTAAAAKAAKATEEPVFWGGGGRRKAARRAGRHLAPLRSQPARRIGGAKGTQTDRGPAAWPDAAAGPTALTARKCLLLLLRHRRLRRPCSSVPPLHTGHKFASSSCQ